MIVSVCLLLIFRRDIRPAKAAMTVDLMAFDTANGLDLLYRYLLG
ncbi:hypothetical protein sync_2785 [Synechococcus sp. CC9311]|nr:hypothetical protein sync_2785 [Synechococcus sp. CC9311]